MCVYVYNKMCTKLFKLARVEQKKMENGKKKSTVKTFCQFFIHSFHHRELLMILTIYCVYNMCLCMNIYIFFLHMYAYIVCICMLYIVLCYYCSFQTFFRLYVIIKNKFFGLRISQSNINFLKI